MYNGVSDLKLCYKLCPICLHLCLHRVGVLYPITSGTPDQGPHASYLRFDKDRTKLRQSILGSVGDFTSELKNRKLVRKI